MTRRHPGKKIIKTAQDDFRAKFKKVKKPNDFKTKLDFVRYVTEVFDADLEYDRTNREEGLDDAQFAAGDQWDKNAKARRDNANKPALVFNRLIAFIGQIVGSRRLNQTEIKVTADDNAHKKTAKIRAGLIRNIQKSKSAKHAFNKAQENQIISGLGNFELAMKYAHDDVFEQDIVIDAVPNAFSIVWDRFSQLPAGGDSTHAAKVRTMTRDDYEREWPDASSAADLTTATDLLGEGIEIGWVTEDDVRVVDFWRVRTRRKIVALLREEKDEGVVEEVIDVTEMDVEEYADRLVVNKRGEPLIREVDIRYAEMYTINAIEILEGPYELPIKRVPFFRVPGWELNVGDKIVRFGLIRFLKDPQRLHNYWRSVIAEKLVKAPKGNWIADQAVVDGKEDQWRNSHNTDDELLTYDGAEGNAPERVDPPAIEVGLIQQADMASQDLRDISNIHEANLGQRSNEVSGKAIRERRDVGDQGTAIYSDNLEGAQEECGEAINDLIPFAYDTARTIKIMGEEGEELTPQVINDTTDQSSIDMTVGKYSITSITGPSTATKRIESLESMLTMVNAMPDTLAVAADKIIEAQDWAGAPEIARRLRRTLPAGTIEAKDMDDEQIAQAQVDKQVQDAQAQKQEQLFQAELREKNAKAELAEQLSLKAKADTAKAFASIDIDEINAIANIEAGRIRTVLEAADKFNAFTTPEPEPKLISTSTDKPTGE